jgi:hypothetical protein
MVWGREEIKTERRARGFSSACSRSLGRRLDRATVAHSFSAPIAAVVVTFRGPPVEWRGKMESPHLGEGPCASGQAWGTVVRHCGNAARALFS